MSNKTYKELCIAFYESTALHPLDFVCDEILDEWTPYKHDGSPCTTEDEFEAEFLARMRNDPIVWNAIVAFDEMGLNADVFPMPEEHAYTLLSALGEDVSSDEDGDSE
jgi:hypothetical protein